MISIDKLSSVNSMCQRKAYGQTPRLNAFSQGFNNRQLTCTSFSRRGGENASSNLGYEQISSLRILLWGFVPSDKTRDPGSCSGYLDREIPYAGI